MKARRRSSLILLVVAACLATALSGGVGGAREAAKTKPKPPTRIIPLVPVAPGETKTVLFSVECTVGLTRGGGLAVAEMIDGERPVIGLPDKHDKTFRRAGVTVTVPDMEEATKIDAQARGGVLSALSKVRAVFPVTVTADADAKPVALDLHLLDSTCSGHCTTDFTVVVTTSEETE
jgi:hypothetical protein